MPIPAARLELNSNEITDVINVKTEPLLIASLINKPGFYPAYHMNKSNWISIKLDEADEKEVKDLIDLSLRLT